MHLLSILAMAVTGSLAMAPPMIVLSPRDLNACITAATNQQTSCINACNNSDSTCIQACVNQSTAAIQACIAQYGTSTASTATATGS